MAFKLVLALRAAQLLIAIILMGLSGYVFHWYDVDTLTDPPKQIDLLIALPIISIISMLYLELTPRFLPKASIGYVHLAVEAVNAFLYFCGFIALSVFLGKLLFCRGKVCAAARADAVFASFGFALWAGTTTMVALECFKDGLTDKKATKAMRTEAKHGPTATSAV